MDADYILGVVRPMKYSTLLFDNDDTLMDFGDAERQGIERTFLQNGIPYNADILASYSEINLSLWKRFERGEIEKHQIYTERFRLFREKHQFDFDIDKVSEDYIINLEYGHTCIDGALELLKTLFGKYYIYIVTNGNKRTQDKRIGDSGLLPYCNRVFVSESSGYQKPHIGYFNYVFEHIEEKDKSKMLIIGDSLSSDIMGGINAGIDTCWYNPKRQKCENIKPKYEIQALDQLYSIL